MRSWLPHALVPLGLSFSFHPLAAAARSAEVLSLLSASELTVQLLNPSPIG